MPPKSEMEQIPNSDWFANPLDLKSASDLNGFISRSVVLEILLNDPREIDRQADQRHQAIFAKAREAAEERPEMQKLAQLRLEWRDAVRAIKTREEELQALEVKRQELIAGHEPDAPVSEELLALQSRILSTEGLRDHAKNVAREAEQRSENYRKSIKHVITNVLMSAIKDGQREANLALGRIRSSLLKHLTPEMLDEIAVSILVIRNLAWGVRGEGTGLAELNQLEEELVGRVYMA